MSVGGAIATYIVIWWTILFAVLPIGVKSQIEDGEVTPGTDAGAPARPMLLKKAVITSIAALPLLGLVWLWNVYGRPI
jgi:predicted secreted protein